MLLALAAGCGGSDGGGDATADPQATTTPQATMTAASPPTPTATGTPAGVVAFAAGGFLTSRSTDAGASWEAVFAGQSSGGVGGVDFVDRQTGWIVGGSHVFHTTTGGADASQWTDESAHLPVEVDLYDVAFVDRAHGVAVGADVASRESGVARPIIVVTSDGGDTWRIADLGFLRREIHTWLTGVCMTSTGHGVAVANRFTRSYDSLIMATSDGGETWDDHTAAALLGPTAVLAAVGCAHDADFWLVGAPSLLLASHDGGGTWTRITVSTSRRDLFLSAVAFADPLHGWVAGYDEIAGEILVFATADGGASWTDRTLLRDVRILESEPTLAIAPVDARSVILVGTDPNSFLEEGTRAFGFFTRDGGDTWIPSLVPAGDVRFADLDLVR